MPSIPSLAHAGNAPHVIPCRQCGHAVRPTRTCWRCGIETPPPFADRPEVVVKIVNGAAAARTYLRGAA